MQKRYSLLLFMMAGVPLAMSFPHLQGWHWLAWLVWVPLLLLARPMGAMAAGWHGALMGWVLGAVALHSMWQITWLTAAMSIAGMGLYYGAWFALLGWAGKRLDWWRWSLLVPLSWWGLEFLRAECWPLFFPYLLLGHTQLPNQDFIQWASVLGVHGLGAWMMSVATALATLLHRSAGTRLRVAAMAMAMFALLLAQNGQTLLDEPMAAPSLAVLGVQLENRLPEQVLLASRNALKRHTDADLLILPEYVSFEHLSPQHDLYRSLAELSLAGPPLLFTAGEAWADGPYAGYRNTLFAFEAGRLVHRQAKSHPVPMLEFAVPAAERRAFDLSIGRIGGAICYDMGFSAVSRDLVDDGARLLVFPAMDHAEWGEEFKRLNAIHAPFRAIEYGRWLVRLASSGISLIVDPRGRSHARLGADAVDGVLYGKVGLSARHTWFSRFGHVLPYLALLVSTALLAAAVRKRNGA